VATVSDPCYLHWENIYCKGQHFYTTYTSAAVQAYWHQMSSAKTGNRKIWVLCSTGAAKTAGELFPMDYPPSSEGTQMSHESVRGKAEGCLILGLLMRMQKASASCCQIRFVLTHW